MIDLIVENEIDRFNKGYKDVEKLRSETESRITTEGENTSVI